jgi:hypothetical protein
MADNVLGAVKIEVSGDWSRLEVDFKSAEKAAQSAGAKIASSMTVSMSQSSSATDSFSAAIDRLIAAQSRENAALSLAIQRNQAMTTSLGGVAQGARNVGTAAHSSVTELQALSGALRVAEGGSSIRAAERFLANIGAGSAAMAIFPAVGAVAVAEAVGRGVEKVGELAQAWDPVISAEKRAAEGAEEFGKKISKLREELAKMADVRFAGAAGETAGKADQAAQLEGQKRFFEAKKKLILDEMSRTAEAGAAGAGAMAVAGNFIPGLDTLGERFTKGAKIDISTQARDLVVVQNELRKIEEQQGDLSTASIQTQSDKIDAEEEKAQSKAARRAESDFAIREWRQKQFEEELKAVQAARNKELTEIKSYNDAMEAQQQRWTKINLDEKRERNGQNIKEAKIDAPLGSRLPADLNIEMSLAKSGVKTTTAREKDIAESQRIFQMAQAVNVPLGTQLKLREDILLQQIALKEEQGQSVSQELQALDALQAQMDRMRQRAAGIAPLLHDLREIGKQVPSQLGGALAHGITSGNAGKEVGKDIRQALQGIGQQMLGRIFTESIQRLITALGLDTLANTLLKFVFGSAAAAQISNTAAVLANTAGQVVVSTSNAVLTTSNVVLTAAVTELAAVMMVNAFLPFADGGRPPLGVPSIVGERGPELFIPDQAGKIVPNHQLAGGAGLMLPMMAAIASNSVGSMNFHAHGMTNPREFVREVARQLPAYLKSTNPKYSPAAR